MLFIFDYQIVHINQNNWKQFIFDNFLTFWKKCYVISQTLTNRRWKNFFRKNIVKIDWWWNFVLCIIDQWYNVKNEQKMKLYLQNKLKNKFKKKSMKKIKKTKSMLKFALRSRILLNDDIATIINLIMKICFWFKHIQTNSYIAKILNWIIANENKIEKTKKIKKNCIVNLKSSFARFYHRIYRNDESQFWKSFQFKFWSC